jgi:hypothetical protein
VESGAIAVASCLVSSQAVGKVLGIGGPAASLRQPSPTSISLSCPDREVSTITWLIEEVMVGKPAVSIALSAAGRRELESLARAHKTGQAMPRRARIVLAAAAGLENKAICAEVEADANTVGK